MISLGRSSITVFFNFLIDLVRKVNPFGNFVPHKVAIFVTLMIFGVFVSIVYSETSCVFYIYNTVLVYI